MDMKRVAVLCVGILVLALVPAAVFAQGWLPGLPSFGGVFGSKAGCGETLSPGLGPLVGYVGWTPGSRNTGFGVGGGPVGGIYQLDQDYDSRGLWLGLQQSAKLSDWLSVIASGWYLFPSNNASTEVYNNGVLGTRAWDTSTQWWFVDAVAALGGGCGCSGLSALVGLRYDYYNTQFTHSNPFFTFPLGAVGDGATVNSQGWIPLIGTQVAYASSTTNLVVRVVGFPYLAGNAKYTETIGGLGAASAQFSGTYNNGYFMEVFSEYSRTVGVGGIGVFGRWNMTHGNMDSDLSVGGLGSSGFRLGLTRTSFTLGASVSLNFNTPL
jgi:hypothetical protein